MLLGGYTEGVSVQQFFNKAYTMRQIGRSEVYYSDPQMAFLERRRITVYKECHCCEQILPDWEFPEAIRNKCLGCDDRSAKSQKKRRGELKEGYIIDVLRKNGYSRGDITPKLIQEKRLSLMAKRNKKVSL
jgi:hypothetical protein